MNSSMPPYAGGGTGSHGGAMIPIRIDPPPDLRYAALQVRGSDAVRPSNADAIGPDAG